MDNETKKIVLSCIEESMQQENFTEMKINWSGANGKGQGFIGDIIFVTVTGTDKKNQHKEIELAVKIGKKNEEFTKFLPIVTKLYQRELYFYEKVIPAFREFQLEKNIANTIDAIPKYYKSFSTDNFEGLVMENLKKNGFVLHERRIPLNLQHIHLVLKNYAKIHALSFALRDQNKKTFYKLTSGYESFLKELIVTMTANDNGEKVERKLREAGRDDLATKYKKTIERGKQTVLLEIIDDVIFHESVLTHADCHNNNFLFKYKDNDEENPLKVAIIDWQLSSLHSPVIDLSYFLYCNAAKECLFQLDELLKFYHSHLTDFMGQLGSDAEKIFPYNTLLKHWKKYSLLQLLFFTSFMESFYIDSELTPSMNDFTESSEVKTNFGEIKLTHEELYKERLVTIFDHYFNFIPT